MKMPQVSRPDPITAPRRRRASPPGVASYPARTGALTGLGAAIQARPLIVGPAHDAHEAEAERVARRVVDEPAPTLGDREPGRAPPIQRRPTPTADVGAPQLDPRRLATGGGAPLDADTRRFMEARLGADFGAVRIHDDPAAHTLSRELAAQAFTHGAHIYMGAGRHDPDTRAGRQLLAHELTHVVQQGGAASSLIQRNPEGDGSARAPTAVGRAFLDRLIENLSALRGQKSALRLSPGTARATVRGMQGAAYEFADRRFLDLLRRCEQDLDAIFTSPPVALTDIVDADDLAQVTAYSKMKKHDARTDLRVDVARGIHAKIEEARPPAWGMLGSKVKRAWAVKRAEKQVDRSTAHRDAFNAVIADRGRVGDPIQHFGVQAAQAVVAGHTGATALFDTLASEYGARASLASVMVSLVWDHVARRLIEHYTRLSGIDWYAPLAYRAF